MDGSDAGSRGLMPTLLCLGLGYCARAYVAEFGARFDRIVGTTRNEERAAAPGGEFIGARSVEMLRSMQRRSSSMSPSSRRMPC